MVKATMPFILNTFRNIFVRLYGSVEEIVTMCLVYKTLWLLFSYPKPIPNLFFSGFGFFVKIYLQESSKLDL